MASNDDTQTNVRRDRATNPNPTRLANVRHGSTIDRQNYQQDRTEPNGNAWEVSTPEVWVPIRRIVSPAKCVIPNTTFPEREVWVQSEKFCPRESTPAPSEGKRNAPRRIRKLTLKPGPFVNWRIHSHLPRREENTNNVTVENDGNAENTQTEIPAGSPWLHHQNFENSANESTAPQRIGNAKRSPKIHHQHSHRENVTIDHKFRPVHILWWLGS